MDVTLALLCDAANTTAEGKLNILGTFDRIGARSFPVSHPAMSLVLRLSATPAEAGDSRELEIRVVGPDGENVGQITGQIDIVASGTPGADSQYQLIFNLPNITFPSAGPYAFHVLVGRDDKAKVSLELVSIDDDSEGHDGN